ncbi:hypothetical protein Rhe02_40330 [Rhizocola hellebori]|uniref:Uncharacterized protein n=1 Tax=Rhizocola hellebori TaxID=1392758 RepID=A0A8J3VHE5_9ACTN|nr:DUF6232 family protein [Rhizocola hellebori]GIH05966.1 hypothetical protein Rhe02_40330 [Rhizocola hellebori]
MTVFYHGPCARITHEVFETRIPRFQLFPIRDLGGIHIVREAERTIMGTPWARAGSTVMVLAAIIAGAVAFWTVGSPSIAITALLVTAVASGVAAGCWQHRDEPYELRAIYRGRAVCLLRTSDERLLGQVRRGLRRALESREFAH